MKGARDLQSEIAELRERNRALADAVVNSAEIIEELEQTKLKLADAQHEAVQAHENTQVMAETIFEQTHDAMIVLDQWLTLVSANQNAREMFSVIQDGANNEIMERITLQYHSEEHRDWLEFLMGDSSHPRIELYKLEQTHSEDVSQEQQKHWIEVSISELQSTDSDAKFLLTAHDITQRKRIEDRFQHQALHDNVTGLPNRRYFVHQLELLIGRPKKSSKPFSVCFLDLDNFKTVNDTVGHKAGDQLLIQVAKRIQNLIRGGSILARFGGDEFALLVPDQDIKTVRTICKRIINELRRPFEINGNEIFIGVSIGTTRFPDDASNVNELMQNADVAMYSAKDSGRNCFSPFTRALADEIKERQSLLDDLRIALDQADIALEYQPKWCLQSKRLVGCEALLRWRRSGELVSPSHLIDVAECSGLILPLGDLIMETAIAQTAAWRDAFSLNGKMAINLSPRQLLDRGFTKRFEKMIAKAGITSDAIEFEITETAMMENFDEAFRRIKELNEIGVAIAIDDFGTGYSSLSYLKSFPVSTLKIDRSFVCDLPNDRKAVAVAEAVLALGHGLGLTVVAEGVENHEQQQFLAEAGCDIMQGFLVSRSLPADEFCAWAMGHAKLDMQNWTCKIGHAKKR